MPRKGASFPITDEWRAAVARELRVRKMRQQDLANAIGCSQPTLSHLLSGVATSSSLVPQIHKALGWAPPRADVPSGDVGELLKIWDRLTELDRARLLERARTLLELSKG